MSRELDAEPTVTILALGPTPYAEAMWEELAGRVDLRVLCYWGQIPGRSWPVASARYPVAVASADDRHPLTRLLLWLYWAFRSTREGPVIIHGYWPPNMLLAYVIALLGEFATVRPLRRRVWIRAEATTDVAGLRRRPLVQRVLQRALLTRARGVLAIGPSQMGYWQALGLARSRVRVSRYTCSTIFRQPSRDERTSARTVLGIRDEEFVAVFAGRLISRKHPEIAQAVVDGFSMDGARRCRLIAAGAGSPLESPNHKSPVMWTGELTEEQLRLVYWAADVLLMPSSNEPWGVVVLEALQSGLAVVTSDEVGAGRDLVIDGYNGRVAPLTEFVPAAISWMRTIAGMSAADRQLMQDRIGASVAGWIPAAAAGEVMGALFVGKLESCRDGAKQ